MAGQELGGRMNHDIGTPIERTQQVGRRQGVVDDQRDSRRVRDLGNRFQIDDQAARVGQGFQEDTLGVRMGGEGLFEIVRVGRIDEMTGPAELVEGMAELSDRAAPYKFLDAMKLSPGSNSVKNVRNCAA